jgi:hypothetical protein
MRIQIQIIFTIIVLLTPIFVNAQEPEQLPPVIQTSAMAEAVMLPDVKMKTRTHPEKIIFTHYKLSKSKPNIDAMARISPFVEKAQEIDKAAMVFSEYNRIGNSFNLHNEKKMLVVHTSLETDEYSSLQNLIVFNELDPKTFFQFKMYNDAIGIVPEDIQKFSRLALSKERAERMFTALKGSGSVTAEFILQPVYADRTEPFMMNDTSHWLMFARIAEFRLWSNNRIDDAELLWFHRADWYSPRDTSNIGELFTQE